MGGICILPILPERMSLHVLPPMTRVRGTHVWLPRPDGFIDTPQYPGMGDPRSGAVLLVMELPDPYSSSEFARWPPAEKLESRRMRVLGKESLLMGAHPGMLFHIEHEKGDTLYDKWMVFFGDARGLVMVASSCRAELAVELSSWLRTLVMAARWMPDAEQPDPPPFLLDAPAGFQPAQRILHGMIFTEDGRAPGPGSEAPFLSVMPMPIRLDSFTPRELSELFLERQRLPGVVEVEIESAGPVLAGGMRGYELVAYGKDGSSDRTLVIYQLLMAIPEGFLLVQGRANAAAREDLLPRMRSAARSVRRTR